MISHVPVADFALRRTGSTRNAFACSSCRSCPAMHRLARNAFACSSRDFVLRRTGTARNAFACSSRRSCQVMHRHGAQRFCMFKSPILSGNAQARAQRFCMFKSPILSGGALARRATLLHVQVADLLRRRTGSTCNAFACNVNGLFQAKPALRQLPSRRRISSCASAVYASAPWQRAS